MIPSYPQIKEKILAGKTEELLDVILPDDIIEGCDEFKGGFLLDAALGVGAYHDSFKLRYMGGGVKNYKYIPFLGTRQWSLELFYYIFDNDLYGFSSETPHGPFYAQGYQYLQDPKDYVHVVTYAYDNGISIQAIKDFISIKGVTLLRDIQIPLSDTHRQLIAELISCGDDNAESCAIDSNQCGCNYTPEGDDNEKCEEIKPKYKYLAYASVGLSLGLIVLYALYKRN